jgi:uncharacterized protein CbrC (UPF0167 family)
MDINCWSVVTSGGFDAVPTVTSKVCTWVHSQGSCTYPSRVAMIMIDRMAQTWTDGHDSSSEGHISHATDSTLDTVVKHSCQPHMVTYIPARGPGCTGAKPEASLHHCRSALQPMQSSSQQQRQVVMTCCNTHRKAMKTLAIIQ